MMTSDAISSDRSPTRWVRAIALVGAGAFLFFGLWAMISPDSFFTALASFEPYNPHLVHDIGAFQIGLGAVLLLAAFPEHIDGLVAALLGTGIGAAAHVVSHFIDLDLGGTPATDIPSLAILAVVLLAAGVARLRHTHRASSGEGAG